MHKFKICVQLVCLAALISLATACNSNCRSCTRRKRSITSDDELARTFGAFLPCCTGCTGNGDISTITNDKCGVKTSGTRIVGGTETEVNEYPWAVALANRNGDWAGCGGSLIASQWVLTAAHCISSSAASNMAVIIGDHDLADASDAQRIVVNVAAIIGHTSYNDATSENDIALLKLETAVDLATYTPVCIPAAGQTYVGQTADVYGWGAVSSGGATSSTLLETAVNVVSNTACNSNYAGAIVAGMLCAGVDAGGKDACQGDSGGPLSLPVNGRHFQIGVVSFGNGCGLAGFPGVYADVSYYREWIECTLKDNGGAVFTA